MGRMWFKYLKSLCFGQAQFYGRKSNGSKGQDLNFSFKYVEICLADLVGELGNTFWT